MIAKSVRHPGCGPDFAEFTRNLAPGRAGIKPLGLRRRDRHGVNVRVIQTRLEASPGIPAVHAAEDAVDFHPCPNDTVIVGIDDEAGHEGYADRTLRCDVDGQFLPLPSAVPRTVDPGWAGAGKENVGIDRVDRQRPDRRQGPLDADALPPRAAVVAHEQARVAACKNGMRLRGMGDQRLYAAIERKRGAMPRPRLSAIRAVPHAPTGRPET